MPTYDFRCVEHHEEEATIVCRITEHATLEKPKCPKCGAEMEQIIKQVSFRLVGGGWGSDGYDR